MLPSPPVIIVEARVVVADESLSIRLDAVAMGNVAVSLPGSLQTRAAGH